MGWVRRHAGATLIACVIGLIFAEVAAAQVHIQGDPVCADCTIRLNHVFDIGGDDAPDALTFGVGGVARTRAGRYLVVDAQESNRISIFDQVGRQTGSIGQPGQGPGEFVDIRALFLDDADSIFVLDDGALRLSVLSPEGTYVRSMHLPFTGLRAMQRLRSGGFLAEGTVKTPQSLGYPLHLLAEDGAFKSSFGARLPLYQPNMRASLRREMATVNDDHVWVSHYLEYVLERWTLEGKLDKLIFRDVDWFPPATTIGRFGPDRQVPPRILDIRVDDEGRLWVVIRVASATWRQAFGPQSMSREGPFYPWADETKAWDTVVEVIDPARGELVTSRRFEHTILEGFVSGGLILGSYLTPAGVPVARFWTLTLTRKNHS